MRGHAAERKPVPRTGDDYSHAAAAKRREFICEVTGAGMDHVSSYSLDPAGLAGNIENFVGVAQVPVGIAGPLLVDGVISSLN
jgi:hydroxymethylglutaryl-CoA reductase (NADPH)